MACRDKSTTYLKGLGYNVVRHPRQGLTPLGIIGKRGNSSHYLGHVQFLLENPPQAFPEIQSGHAGNISGQQSDALKLKIGLNILGNIIGAMGGNLGVTASYTDATRIRFTYKDVMVDEIPMLQFGQTVQDAVLDINNPIVAPYLERGSELLLISNIIKSNKIEVDYQRGAGVSASVDVPVIQQAVGGSVSIAAQADAASKITFSGNAQLAFGFQAFAIGVDKNDGTITLQPTRSGVATSEDLLPRTISDDALIDI